MSARESANFDPDRANLVELAAVGAFPLLDYLLAEDALAQELVVVAELFAAVLILFGKASKQFVLELLHQRVAFGLGVFSGIESIGQALANAFLQVVVVRLVDLDGLEFALGLAGALAQLQDGVA